MRTLLKFYQPLIKFFVRRRFAAVFLAVVLIFIGIIIFPQLGSEFTPTLQEGTIVLRLTMAPSISLNESIRITQIVERRVMKVREVKEVITRIGGGRLERIRIQ